MVQTNTDRTFLPFFQNVLPKLTCFMGEYKFQQEGKFLKAF